MYKVTIDRNRWCDGVLATKVEGVYHFSALGFALSQNGFPEEELAHIGIPHEYGPEQLPPMRPLWWGDEAWESDVACANDEWDEEKLALLFTECGVELAFEGYQCSECELELDHFITDLPTSALGLLPDGDYPYRCVLVYGPHCDDLEKLPFSEVKALMRDIVQARDTLTNLYGVQFRSTRLRENKHLSFEITSQDDPIPRLLKSKNIIQDIRMALD